MMLTNLTDYQLIHVAGDDAHSFLQGQLTCDVRQANEQQALLGAHCNTKGRMVSLFCLVKSDDGYRLCLPTEISNLALASLKKYAIFSKVDISLDNTQRLYLSDQTRQSAPNLQSIRLPGSNNYYLIMGHLSHESNYNPSLIHQWHLDNIRAGIPRLYANTSEQFLPHEINLPKLGGVSFSKGCYLGQEIIARMQHVAKLKKRLYHVSCQSAIEVNPGSKVYVDNKRDKTIAYLIDSAIEQNITECLVVLNDEQAHKTQLCIDKHFTTVKIHIL